MAQGGKRKIFAIMEIFYRYSDSEHTLNSSEILQHLKNHYQIEAERKSIYRDIYTLQECGVDIERSNSSKDGFFLASRRFEVAEVRLLIDAILGARFVTSRKTKELINKLSDELSVFQAKGIESQTYYDNRVKFDNEQIYYIVDTINQAIAQNKKICFVYHHKMIKYNQVRNNVGKGFVFSPYALFWSQDKYYVAGNYSKYDTVSNYRVDRMSNVQIIDEKARPFSEVCSYKNYFDTADYVNKNFMVYNGDENTLELVCDNSLLEIMFDRFGKKAKFTSNDNDTFRLRASAYISDGLIDWLLPYCDRCYINEPTELRESLMQRLDMIHKFQNNRDVD